MSKVILVLLGFLAAVYADCNNNGVTVGSTCACYSGFSGFNCVNNIGTCAPQFALPLNTTSVAELNTYSVHNDGFVFSVVSDALFHRYFDDISLAGNVSCSYPGTSFFQRTYNDSPDCQDSYNGNFTIADVVGCGFTTSEVGNSFVIAGSLHVSAVDDLGTFRSVPLSRNTRSVLNIEISIPNTVFVNTTTPLTVFSSIQPTYAITVQSYDFATDTTTIVLTTSVQWPYQLTNPGVTGGVTPSNTEVTDNSNGCDQSSGDCFQDTTITFAGVAEGPCDLTGAYTFTWNYGCRTGQSVCPVDGSGIETATANIHTDDACSKVTVVADISGSLQSYADDTFSTPQLVFVADQTMHFLATFSSDVSILSVAVNTLSVTQLNQSPQFIVIGGVEQALGGVVAYGLDTTSSAEELGFHIDALADQDPSPFLFDTSVADAVYTFTVEVTFDITYKTSFGRRRDTISESLTFKHHGVLDSSIKADSVHAGLNNEGTNSGYKVAATVVPFAFAAAGVAANNL